MVDWSVFGFDGRDGTQSTYWLGSQGANTVCHYDTYGCNLVAQIYGRYVPLLNPFSAIIITIITYFSKYMLIISITLYCC